MNHSVDKTQLCPCGTGEKFAVCCGPFLSGSMIPETPEQLMRSRYTAYYLSDMEYIAKTMKPPASEGFDKAIEKKHNEAVHWQRLEVLDASVKDNQGFVEFSAYFIEGDKEQVLREKSEFKREGEMWYYVNGISPQSTVTAKPPIGRNDACLCGSGKKYKKCCGFSIKQ